MPEPDGGARGRSEHRSPAESDDARLARRVTALLRAHPQIREDRIAVQVQNGVVLLGGTAGSTAAKRLAGDLVRATAGTRDVCNMLWADRVGADDLDEVSRRFDEIVAAGSAARSPVRLWAALTAAVSGAWWLLVILIAVAGWIGVVLLCLGAAAALRSLRPARGRRR